jgi:hypothetical protein
MKHRKMQRHHLAALIPLLVALRGPASAQSITAITANPQAGNNIFKRLGHGPQVATICHDGGQLESPSRTSGATTRRSIGGTACTPTKPNRQEHLPAWSTPLVSESTRTVSLCEVGGFMRWTSGLSACRSRQFIFANNEGNTTVNLQARRHHVL